MLISLSDLSCVSWRRGLQHQRNEPGWRSRTELPSQAAFCFQSHFASSPSQLHAGRQKEDKLAPVSYHICGKGLEQEALNTPPWKCRTNFNLPDRREKRGCRGQKGTTVGVKVLSIKGAPSQILHKIPFECNISMYIPRDALHSSQPHPPLVLRNSVLHPLFFPEPARTGLCAAHSSEASWTCCHFAYMELVEEHRVRVPSGLRRLPELLLGRVAVHGTQSEQTVCTERPRQK